MCLLHHINIVALLAMIFELGHYGIVMEYVLRGTLDDFLFNYLVRCSFSAFLNVQYKMFILPLMQNIKYKLHNRVVKNKTK